MARLSKPDPIAAEIMEAVARQRAREPERHYLGMSAIGERCKRKLWYSFRGFTPKVLPGRAVRIFRLGDSIEEHVIADLQTAGYRIEGQQNSYSDHNGFFRGHCDGIIHGVTSQPHILEVKSANKWRFNEFRKHGVRKTEPIYYAQTQCYMGYEGLKRALVVIDCKDTSDIYTERIHLISAGFQALREKALRIIIAETPPAKAYKRSGKKCEWCDFEFHCWEMPGAIQMKEHCGTCHYMGWNKEIRPWCFHPDHPYEIKTWPGRCDDWSFLEGKGTPVNPIESQRPPRVGRDELREFSA